MANPTEQLHHKRMSGICDKFCLNFETSWQNEATAMAHSTQQLHDKMNCAMGAQKGWQLTANPKCEQPRKVSHVAADVRSSSHIDMAFVDVQAAAWPSYCLSAHRPFGVTFAFFLSCDDTCNSTQLTRRSNDQNITLPLAFQCPAWDARRQVNFLASQGSISHAWVLRPYGLRQRALRT